MLSTAVPAAGAPIPPAETETVRPLVGAPAAAPSPPSAHPFLSPADPRPGQPGPGAVRPGQAFEPLPMAPEPVTGLYGDLNEPGIAAGDAGGITPPDTTGAIGPSHYVEMTNGLVLVHDRALGQVARRSLRDFAGWADSGSVVDPQIQWDEQAGRWLFAVLVSRVQENALVFGWSRTADPTDLVNGWCRYRSNTGVLLEDFPKLGHDDDYLILGTNVFEDTDADPATPRPFRTSRIWAAQKPPRGSSDCPTTTVRRFGAPESPLRSADGDRVFTPMPANTLEARARGYVVAADSADANPGTQIMAWHVDPGASGAELIADGNIDVSANGPYLSPEHNEQDQEVPQPGTANELDSMQANLTQAVSATDPEAGAEAVWTQHTVAGPGGSAGRTEVRWYELLPASRSARQQGVIRDPSHYVFNAAISPARNGTDATISYNVGSGSLLPEIRARSRRRPDTPLGDMGPEITLGTSAAAAQDRSCRAPDPTHAPICRWGDYAGASPDPQNATVVWGSNQALGPPRGSAPAMDLPAWTTRNFAISPNQAPAASFTAPERAAAGESVAFDASGSGDPNGSIASYLWDLDGDGSFETNTGTLPRVERAYTGLGPQTVRLQVVDDRGDRSPAAVARTVTIEGAPAAVLTANPNPARTRQPVTLEAVGSRDPEGRPLRFAWDLDGDGTFELDTAETPLVARSFPRPLEANVGVRATDDQGRSAVATVALAVVRSAPRMRFARVRSLRLSRGAVALRLSCLSSGPPCLSGRVTLATARPVRLGRRRRIVTLGGRSFRLSPGRSLAVRIPLSRSSQALVRRLRRTQVRATATARDELGNPGATRQIFTLLAPRR